MRHLSVPGYIHTTFQDYLYHFWFFITGLFTRRARVVSQIQRLAQQMYFFSETQVVVGYSSRCLFDVFLSNLGGRKICVTPFLHTGFQRIIEWNQYETYVIDVSEDCRLGDIDTAQLASCDAVLITHVFGYPLDVDALVRQARDLKIPVFEDCVQAGFISAYQGHPDATISIFSGGQDKLPVSFGGGLGAVRSPEVYARLVENLARLPLDKGYQRWLHLVKKVPILLAYNAKSVLWLMMNLMAWLKVPSYAFAEKFRQNLPGFVHDRQRYLKQPSVFQLLSIRHSIARRYADLERECRKKRNLFLTALHEKKSRYLPWYQTLRYKASTNFYFHLHVADVERVLRLLDQAGFCAMPQQSWYADRAKAPTAARLVDNMVILPSFMTLSPNAIVALARALP
jgi:dTDP-4-amino-4,6-dideoxygalactose transaminase